MGCAPSRGCSTSLGLGRSSPEDLLKGLQGLPRRQTPLRAALLAGLVLDEERVLDPTPKETPAVWTSGKTKMWTSAANATGTDWDWIN